VRHAGTFFRFVCEERHIGLGRYYASLHTRSGRSSRHASPRDTVVSPLDRYAWGVCPCPTPEPADYLSAQDVVWDTRALRLALPEILRSRGNSSSRKTNKRKVRWLRDSNLPKV
jgi:hypothetical protein